MMLNQTINTYLVELAGTKFDVLVFYYFAIYVFIVSIQRISGERFASSGSFKMTVPVLSSLILIDLFRQLFGVIKDSYFAYDTPDAYIATGLIFILLAGLANWIFQFVLDSLYYKPVRQRAEEQVEHAKDHRPDQIIKILEKEFRKSIAEKTKLQRNRIFRFLVDFYICLSLIFFTFHTSPILAVFMAAFLCWFIDPIREEVRNIEEDARGSSNNMIGITPPPDDIGDPAT